MRALLFAMLATVAAVGLAGCAGTTGTSASAPGSSESPAVSRPPSSPVPSQPAPSPSEPKPPAGKPSAPVSISSSGELVVPDGVTTVPADQVDSSALPAYYEHRGQVWMFDDGYSLQMFAAASTGCSDAEAVVVDQSGTDVRITLRPLPAPPGGMPDDGGVCTTVMTPRPVTVTLDQPLGDRKIYLASGR